MQGAPKKTSLHLPLRTTVQCSLLLNVMLLLQALGITAPVAGTDDGPIRSLSHLLSTHSGGALLDSHEEDESKRWNLCQLYCSLGR